MKPTLCKRTTEVLSLSIAVLYIFCHRYIMCYLSAWFSLLLFKSFYCHTFPLSHLLYPFLRLFHGTLLDFTPFYFKLLLCTSFRYYFVLFCCTVSLRLYVGYYCYCLVSESESRFQQLLVDPPCIAIITHIRVFLNSQSFATDLEICASIRCVLESNCLSSHIRTHSSSQDFLHILSTEHV